MATKHFFPFSDKTLLKWIKSLVTKPIDADVIFELEKLKDGDAILHTKIDFGNGNIQSILPTRVWIGKNSLWGYTARIDVPDIQQVLFNYKLCIKFYNDICEIVAKYAPPEYIRVAKPSITPTGINISGTDSNQRMIFNSFSFHEIMKVYGKEFYKATCYVKCQNLRASTTDTVFDIRHSNGHEKCSFTYLGITSELIPIDDLLQCINIDNKFDYTLNPVLNACFTPIFNKLKTYGIQSMKSNINTPIYGTDFVNVDSYIQYTDLKGYKKLYYPSAGEHITFSNVEL